MSDDKEISADDQEISAKNVNGILLWLFLTGCGIFITTRFENEYRMGSFVASMPLNWIARIVLYKMAERTITGPKIPIDLVIGCLLDLFLISVACYLLNNWFFLIWSLLDVVLIYFAHGMVNRNTTCGAELSSSLYSIQVM